MDMVPTNDVVPRPSTLFGGDSVTINQGDGNTLNLIKADFTPGRTTDTSMLTLATFDGYAAKTSTITPNVGRDPSNGDFLVEIPAPAGGWVFEVTGLTGLPQTIYGVTVTGVDSSDTWASAKFPVPVVLTTVGDLVRVDSVTFRLRNAAMG